MNEGRTTSRLSGHISHLNLGQNRLSGSIPSRLGNLTTLQELRLQLSHNLSVLQSEHAELMLSLQELISQRALGFSATFGSRLMSRMMSLMKDFTTALEALAGIPAGTVSVSRTGPDFQLGYSWTVSFLHDYARTHNLDVASLELV